MTLLKGRGDDLSGQLGALGREQQRLGPVIEGLRVQQKPSDGLPERGPARLAHDYRRAAASFDGPGESSCNGRFPAAVSALESYVLAHKTQLNPPV